MTIHAIIHDHPTKLWCGPAAIALVTGQPTSVIHRMLLEHRRVTDPGRSPVGIKGIYWAEMFAAMRQLGYAVKAQELIGGPQPSLLEFALARKFDHLHQAQPCIISLPEHFGVLYRDRYYDNRNPAGVRPGDVEWGGQRVNGAWAYVPVAAPVLPAKRPPAPSRDPDLVAAHRLAARYGITIEHDGYAYLVLCPDEIDPVDDVLDHLPQDCDGPAEVLRRVYVYAELLQHIRANGGVLV